MKVFVLTLFFIGAFGAPRRKLDPRSSWSRVVDGNKATEGQFPFQILIETETGYIHCGGSILDEVTILSAASCSNRPYSERAVAGEYDLSIETGREQTRAIASVTNHEAYEYFLSQVNDIAILKTETPFYFNEYVGSIALPTTQNEEYIQGYNCTVSGYGSGSEDFLTYGDNKVLSDQECQSKYTGETIYASSLCSGEIGGGTAACLYDDGAPLINGTYKAGESTAGAKQIGIYSWTTDCGNAMFPSVNTQVSYYLDWIADNR